MDKVRKYFATLPFSFRSAFIATLLVIVFVSTHFLVLNYAKDKPLNLNTVIFYPVLNNGLWLLLAPWLYTVILKNDRPKEIRRSSLTRNIRIIGWAIVFGMIHEFIGVLILNVIYIFIWEDSGFSSFTILPGLHGFVKTILEFWILYFVLLNFHNKKKYEAFELKNAQLESNLLKAQMSALKNQLHPHFLFNTFNTISSLMEEDVELAQRMIAKLGALLRKILKLGDKSFISVQEELELAKLYLEVEQIRFKDRITSRFFVDPSTEEILIPTLLLQPAIENAIKHGFYNKLTECEISIKILREEGFLTIKVKDNGAGVKKDSFSFGIGLSNMEERLKKCYQDRFSLKAEPVAGEEGFLLEISIQEDALVNEDIRSIS